MVCIMTEKPSAARNFAKALGGMKGNFEGTDYVIAVARGHLFEFAKPDGQVDSGLVARYKSWDLSKLPWDETDFQWKREKKKDVSDTLKDMKVALSGADEICIAGDVDPSGEGLLIQIEILEELNIHTRNLTRMYFADESAKELQKGFRARKPVPDYRRNDEYLKAWFRTRWDFLSMQFSRIATKVGDGKSVLRQGRLKSAMVVLVGDQLKLAADYKKIPFYQNRFKDENGVVYTNSEEPTYPKPDDVPQVYHGSDVVCDSKQMKATPPPKFMDLAALSAKLASKGFKSKTVLGTYQKLYESQLVSYPRTEDKTVTPEQFNDLLPHADAIARLVGVDPGLLTHRAPRSTHVKTGGAHGANRPGLNVPKSLQELQAYGPGAVEIYTLLAKSYLASLAEDYEYESQKGHVKDYPKFVGTVQIPKAPGWKAVYGADLDEDDADTDAKGLGTHAEPFVFEGFPPKPAAPTMKWLMAQLEKRDVGTGATRTSTYAEVTSDTAKYPLMVDKKGKITFTEFGDMSYRLLPGTHIGDLTITERVQQQMRDIAAGKLSADECLHEIQAMVADDIRTMLANGEAMRKELNIMPTSSATGAPAVERYKGTWDGREVNFKRDWSGHHFDDGECERLCAGEEIEIEAVSSKTGKPFRCRGVLAEQEYNGTKYVGFKNNGFVNSAGQKDGVPDEWCKHQFTQDEKDALEAGLSIECSDFVSKKGKKFSAKVRYGRNERGYMGIIADFG